jgi:biotin carboxyl carrier protein
MKLFLEFPVSVQGFVTERTVTNGQSVEYNQILMRIP